MGWFSKSDKSDSNRHSTRRETDRYGKKGTFRTDRHDNRDSKTGRYKK